jgi:hypothetical protein
MIVDEYSKAVARIMESQYHLEYRILELKKELAAARAEALEEAAQRAIVIIRDNDLALTVAASIRALKERKP